MAKNNRTPETIQCDVVVMGGGLAGTTLAATLAEKGLDVVCIEPREDAPGSVGESLDWTSPGLLQRFGFPLADLLEQGYGTEKRHIRVVPAKEPAFDLAPHPSFAMHPWRLDLVTIHLDRRRFDQACRRAAQGLGVRFLWEHVSRVHVDGERVEGVETSSALVRAHRYVDASGRARLIGRAFSLPLETYGAPKVSLWTYLPGRAGACGTTLTLEESGYLKWTWEIPVSPDTSSVGYTAPVTEFKRMIRTKGGSSQSLLRDVLSAHEAFRDRLPPKLDVQARSFQSYVLGRASGPNWLLVGESAAMIDPLTSNGVTSALRFGDHAAWLIEDSIDAGELPAADRRRYDGCLRSMAAAFNRYIERAVYEPALRERLGTYRAALVYVLFGYFANAVYQKLRPRGTSGWLALQAVLLLFKAWFGAWCLAAALRGRRRSSAARLDAGRTPQPEVANAPVVPDGIAPALPIAPADAFQDRDAREIAVGGDS